MSGGLLIAVPHTRPFYGETLDSLIMGAYPRPVGFSRLEGYPLDFGRNKLVDHFLHDTNHSHLLFVDSDATFHPDSAIRLLERNKPLICGAMYHRGWPPTPTMGQYIGKDKGGDHIFGFGETMARILEHAKKHGLTPSGPNELVLPKTDTDLYRIDGAGMHFTMIHREVFERLEKPYFVANEGMGGEDFYFCIKAMKAGIPMYCDLSVHTGHLMGPAQDTGIREFLSYMKYVRGIDDDPSRFDTEETLEVGSWDL